MFLDAAEFAEDVDYKAQLNGSTAATNATNAAAAAAAAAGVNVTQEPREDYVRQKISLEDARPASTKGRGASGTSVGRPGALAYLRRHEQLEKSPSSTDMIAAKNSNELKKKYLFNYSGSVGGGVGGVGGGGLAQKSASVTNLDSRMRSFVDTISEAQKLLNPAPQPSVPMQVYSSSFILILIINFNFNLIQSSF